MATQEKYPNRWIQLVLGIVCMATIANCQYGWTLFVAPIEDKYHWARTAIQLSFTIFLFFETWLVPLEGWGVDKFGPRPVIIFGAILSYHWLDSLFQGFQPGIPVFRPDPDRCRRRCRVRYLFR